MESQPTPGINPTSALRHPRRVPAHQSVSLRRKNTTQTSPLRNQYTGEDESDQNSGGSSSGAQLRSKESSGELSDPDRWFAKSNKNPNLHQRDFKDEDAPYQPHIQSENGNTAVYGHMQATPAQLASENSSDEYRGVIDDLTIQIKKLQKKLTKYERLQDNRLDTVKRIEVKTFGLGVEKKRQLEQILSKFSEDLDSSAASEQKESSSSIRNSSSMVKGSSSSMSRNVLKAARFKPADLHGNNDSGYGSLAPGAQSTHSMSYSAMRETPQPPASPQARNISIENYLHDIPAGLLPQQSVAMSEKAKQKLVVKRLEQILGGRDALPGVHHQSIQQQEVAQSAAIAERSAMDALGQMYALEGTREAPIMPITDDENLALADVRPEATQGNLKSELVHEKDFAAGKNYPEQRPTRPLDLDPDRAQTPMENVRYLQHLGFIPDEIPLTPSSDNEGWIYLNLMINLAQLHTLNVTTDFVQDAIARYSDQFELSSDGRKVRWTQHTGPSKVSEDFLRHSNINDRSRKRSHLMLAVTEPEVPKNQHLYTPMFLPKEETMSDDTSSVPEDEACPEVIGEVENGPGFVHGSGPTPGPTRKRDDAPMIFYHQTRFYTDLSADPNIPIMSYANYNKISMPLGERPVPRARRNSVQPDHRPLVDSIPIDEEMCDVDDVELIDVDFPAASPRRVTFVDPDEKEVDFAVCGIGGVYPEDHFSITVQLRHSPPSVTLPKIRTHSLPNRLITASNQQHPRRHPSIVSTKRSSLIPSELPPPCYDFNSDSEFDSDNESDASSQSGSSPIPSTTDLPRLATLSTFASNLPNKRRRINMSRQFSTTSSTTTSSHRGHVNRTRVNYSPSASSSTSSNDDHSIDRARSVSEGIDFLADARRVDPELIGRAERQYDAEMAERLAEDIPAGSSAATAGGGSGWGSPRGAGKVQGKRKRRRDEDAGNTADMGEGGEVSDAEMQGGSVAS